MASRLPLSTLLSPVLVAFTLEFERDPDLSLAMNSNVMRKTAPWMHDSAPSPNDHEQRIGTDSTPRQSTVPATR
jgi:hypothetical protein